MFNVARAELKHVLEDFGVVSELKSVSELQRSNYKEDNPGTQEVRLIVKAELTDGPPLVVRLWESQCRFADALRENGIATPRQYRSGSAFVKTYSLCGRNVFVTVERFVEREIRVVDPQTAEKTGELLARMHNIAEQRDLHAAGRVLFDPFAPNDLFDVDAFLSVGEALSGENRALFDQIRQTYNDHMDTLSALNRRPRYAVQGDISDCNLYETASGEIGAFDFNRSGDNVLFCDAVMQAVFEARLMDYPPDLGEDREEQIFTAFLRGYCSVRPFSEAERACWPYLYAVIDAFWSSDVRWREDSLTNAVAAGDRERTRERLETILRRLENLGGPGREKGRNTPCARW